MSLEDIKKIKEEIPHESPVNPVELTLDSEFQFHCHKNISCFNECCKNIDITLMPYDIQRPEATGKYLVFRVDREIYHALSYGCP